MYLVMTIEDGKLAIEMDKPKETGALLSKLYIITLVLLIGNSLVAFMLLFTWKGKKMNFSNSQRTRNIKLWIWYTIITTDNKYALDLL